MTYDEWRKQNRGGDAKDWLDELVNSYSDNNPARAYQDPTIYGARKPEAQTFTETAQTTGSFRPDFENQYFQQSGAWEQYVTASKVNMDRYSAPLQSAYLAEQESQRTASALQQEALGLYEAYKANPTQETSDAYVAKYNEYKTAQYGAEQKATIYDGLRTNYNSAVAQYNDAVNSYNAYKTTEQEKYDKAVADWRAGIRSAEDVQAERERLQKAKTELILFLGKRAEHLMTSCRAAS